MWAFKWIVHINVTSILGVQNNNDDDEQPPSHAIVITNTNTRQTGLKATSWALGHCLVYHFLWLLLINSITVFTETYVYGTRTMAMANSHHHMPSLTTWMVKVFFFSLFFYARLSCMSLVEVAWAWNCFCMLVVVLFASKLKYLKEPWSDVKYHWVLKSVEKYCTIRKKDIKLTSSKWPFFWWIVLCQAVYSNEKGKFLVFPQKNLIAYKPAQFSPPLTFPKM